jgi:hypothetical protein
MRLYSSCGILGFEILGMTEASTQDLKQVLKCEDNTSIEKSLLCGENTEWDGTSCKSVLKSEDNSIEKSLLCGDNTEWDGTHCISTCDCQNTISVSETPQNQNISVENRSGISVSDPSQNLSCGANEILSELGHCVTKPWYDFLSCAEESAGGACTDGNTWVAQHCATTCANLQPPPPSEPGCHVLMPSGCHNHPGFTRDWEAKTNVWVKDQSWISRSQTDKNYCENVRKRDYDNWCGVANVTTHFN